MIDRWAHADARRDIWLQSFLFLSCVLELLSRGERTHAENACGFEISHNTRKRWNQHKHALMLVNAQQEARNGT